MYCDRRGNGQKPTRTKPPGQKPLRTIEIEFVQGTSVLGLLKIGGFEMCDVLSGGPGMCDSVTGGGGENWQKIASRTLWTAPWLHVGCCVLLRGVSFWSLVPVWLLCSEGPFRLWVHQHGMISPLSCVPC